jgi:hypothetical protein
MGFNGKCANGFYWGVIFKTRPSRGAGRQCGGTRPPGAFPAGRVCFAAGWRALSPAEACAERPLHHAFSDAQIGRRTDLEVRRVCTCAANRFRRVTGNSTRDACSTREAPLQRTATGPRSHDRSHFAQPRSQPLCAATFASSPASSPCRRARRRRSSAVPHESPREPKPRPGNGATLDRR